MLAFIQQGISIQDLVLCHSELTITKKDTTRLSEATAQELKPSLSYFFSLVELDEGGGTRCVGVGSGVLDLSWYPPWPGMGF